MVKLLALILLALLFIGCASKTEWYENGQMKSKREGCIDFSDGAGKQMPLSHLSVIGK